jgi:autotransporter-associated beta strand protein
MPAILSSSVASISTVSVSAKPSSRLSGLFAFCLALSAGAPVFAVDQTYDATNAANVWDLATQNWDGSTATWFDNNNAIFSGTGETVTVNGPIVFDNMTFSANGYTLANGTGSLSLSNDLASTITVSTGTATIAEILGDNLAGASALTKAGAGTLVLSGSNTYTGATTLSAGVLWITNANSLGTTTAGTTQSGASELRLSGNVVTAAEPISITGGGIGNAGAIRNFADNNTYSGTVTLAGQTRIVADTGTLTLSAANSVTAAANQNLIVSGAGNIVISGAISTGSGFLTKDTLIGGGTGTLTLGGTNTYAGATTVIAGTLKLDYAANDTTKLSDTAALVLGGGTVELAGGTHTEVVSATTLTANTSSVISRSSGSAVLQLNTVTPNAGTALVVTSAGIATTDNAVTNGILGFWARTNIGGVSTWGTSAGTPDSPIVAFTGYTDINRLGGVLPNLATNHIRIVDGGTSGNVTLAGGALTQAYSIQVDASAGRTTIAPAANTDVLNVGDDVGGAIWQTANAGSLTIGTTVGNGILTAGATPTAVPANLRLINDSVANDFVVNSVITNNDTDVVSVSKSGAGTVVLNGNNTFTGSLSVAAGGMLVLTGNNAARPSNVANSTVVGSGGILRLEANAGNTTAGVSTVLFNEQSGTVQPFILSTGGTLQLRSDSAITFAGGNNFGGLGSANVTIDVNRLTAAGTNNTLTFAPGGFNVNTTTINVTGGNGYKLAIGKINNVTGAANAVMTLNPTGASMSVAGYGGTTAFTSTLLLSGTSTGNIVTAPVTNTTSATPSVISVTKTGTSTWELASENTYTGTTNVRQGTLTLSGNRTGAAGAFSVGDTAGLDGTLNITAGDFALGTANFFVSQQANSSTVNQSAGSISFTGGNQLLVGNSAVGSVGNYNLSGGTITGGSNANRGVILGVNTGATGIFTLSGTGNLAMGSATLQVGRSDSAALNTTGVFNQTGGTAAFGTLTVGGGAGSVTAGTKGTLNLTGGTFTAANFPILAGADNGSAVIKIGGTAKVTLPAFPTTRGLNATATITFDGGTLSPSFGSTDYMSGLTNAFVTANGANFDVPAGSDIAIGQVLENASGQAGTVNKLGAGMLALLAANTYTGATKVDAGTLLVGGSISASPTTVNAGGTLAAGIVADTIGTAGIGALTIAGTGTLKLDINITDATTVTTDLFNVTGNLNLSGSAVLALQNLGSNVALTQGTAITFIDYSGTWNGGTFAGLADDSLLTVGATQFRISYNGVNNNDSAVTLVAIPEPGSATLLVGGVAGLLGMRRRRRSA